MQLVDFSGLVISNLMRSHRELKMIDLDTVRSDVLASILSYRQKFKNNYGDMILCLDDKNHYWRKDIFPYYKANRKKQREKSAIDWKEVYRVMDTLKEEFTENLPYKMLGGPSAEADDVIATVCGYVSAVEHPNPQKIVIISRDGDLMQLQRYSNVTNWCPIEGKFKVEPDPERCIKEHIIRGDDGDGVPNMLSPDDVFVRDDIIQTAMRKPIFEKFMNTDLESGWGESWYKNYCRNQRLVDLGMVPYETVQKPIIEELKIPPQNGRGKMLPYFMKHKLRLLTPHLGHF